ncbi:MAG: hypothetical protein ACSLFN_05645 [Candidatus Limnocylindrales bacterium]
MVETRDDDAGAKVAASGAVATSTGQGLPDGSRWKEEQRRAEGDHDGGDVVRHPVGGLEQTDLASRCAEIDADRIARCLWRAFIRRRF